MIKTDKYRRIKSMMNEDIKTGNINNNSYYLGYIHAIEDNTHKACKELRNIASNIKTLEHLKYWID